MTGSYDSLQVGLSVLIAISASYAALDLAGRVTATHGWARLVWLTGGTISMGIGIWAMHFVGMLAYNLPIPVSYHWPTVLLSLLLPILASALALAVVSQEKMSPVRALLSGLVMGGGIAAMHYVGMAAMRMAASVRFNPFGVFISVLLAIAFSLAALWLAFHFRDEQIGVVVKKLGSAAIMGFAVSGMHYTGMWAATFTPTHRTPDLSHTVSLSSLSTLGIAAVTLLLLGLAILSCDVDRRFDGHSVELRSSAEQNRRLFERSLAGMYRATLDGRILDCNDAFALLLGYSSRTECLSNNAADLFIDSTEMQKLISQLKEQTVLSQPVLRNVERCVRKRDGTQIWVLENVALVNSHGAESPTFESTLIDITDRKRSESERLAETRRQAEDTVDQWQKRMELAREAGLRIGLWDWDIVNSTVVWSDETYRQFGFSPASFSGKIEDAVARIHPEDRLRVEEVIRGVLEGGSAYAAQYRIVRPDGSTCWVDAHGILARNHGSTHMLGIGIDITNIKKTEGSLEEAKTELARVARIATIGELTTTIAHEINQPLGAVVANGSASLRWLDANPPNLNEAREAMARAIDQAIRASEVIARIRALVRKATPQMQPLDINQVIREVLTLTKSELLKGEVRVQLDLAAGLPAVPGDRVQLEQVMMNLILNGIDAMNKIADRPRNLIIRTKKNGDDVIVQIEDSGPGLKLEETSLIFEPFFTTKAQGIGMGLSISRAIVEAHGGRLWAAASAHGALFQFLLPVGNCVV
ncbi:MAG TPA: MHYT domain-containing protein [Acidobacteriaceae bacterium]